MKQRLSLMSQYCFMKIVLGMYKSRFTLSVVTVKSTPQDLSYIIYNSC